MKLSIHMMILNGAKVVGRALRPFATDDQVMEYLSGNPFSSKGQLRPSRRSLGSRVRSLLGLLGLPISIESWKCDQCERVGEGDGNSFFALEEIDHFLEFRCRGSLRRDWATPRLSSPGDHHSRARMYCHRLRCRGWRPMSSLASGVEGRESLCPCHNPGSALFGGAWIADQELTGLLAEAKS